MMLTMDSPSSESWWLEQAEIDELITELQLYPDTDSGSQLFQLRRRRNQLAPLIAQLPPEVLSRIIYAYSLIGAQHGKPYQWLTITHVSSYLRDLALADPTLWTTIFIPVSEDLLLTLLSRSKSLPLIITFTTTPSADIVELFQTHLSRIQSISLDAPLPIQWRSSIPNLTSLEQLSLRYTQLHTPNISPPVIPPHTQLQSFAIELHNTIFTWSSKAIFNPQLTSISIKGTQQGITTHELIDTLSSLPNLQHLHLFDILLVGSWPHQSRLGSTKVLSLPKLESLYLGDNNLIFLGGLLANIDFPLGAKIAIVTDGRRRVHTHSILERGETNSVHDTTPNTFEQLFLTLTERFSPFTDIENEASLHPSLPKLYNMLILHQTDKTKFGRFTFSLSSSSSSGPKHDFLNLTFKGGISSTPSTISAFLTLLNKLPLQHLMNIDLRGSEEGLSASVMPFVLSLPGPSNPGDNMTRLNIVGTITKAFTSLVDANGTLSPPSADAGKASQAPAPSFFRSLKLKLYPEDDPVPPSPPPSPPPAHSNESTTTLSTLLNPSPPPTPKSLLQTIQTDSSCLGLISSFPLTHLNLANLKKSAPPSTTFAQSIFDPSTSVCLDIASGKVPFSSSLGMDKGQVVTMYHSVVERMSIIVKDNDVCVL